MKRARRGPETLEGFNTELQELWRASAPCKFCGLPRKGHGAFGPDKGARHFWTAPDPVSAARVEVLKRKAEGANEDENGSTV